jgi:hypothetical protein
MSEDAEARGAGATAVTEKDYILFPNFTAHSTKNEILGSFTSDFKTYLNILYDWFWNLSYSENKAIPNY